jgi:cell division septation protein DedD/pimeloyl-ACP methyl ester carboxylesterase
MTVPELIVGIAIASSVTVVSAQIVSNQAAGQRLTEARADISGITREIRDVLSNSEACKRTLAGFAPGATITRIYRVSRNLSIPGNPWQETVSHVVDTTSANKVRIKSLTVQGAVAANNMGEMRLVARFEVNRDVIGVREYERDINVRTRVDSTGTIVSCAGIEGDKSTRLLCADPIAACANHPDYCREQVYVNPVEGCVCLGSRTVGTNIFGVNCGGWAPPSPTPTPTPSPTVSPTPSPTTTPTVTPPTSSPTPSPTPTPTPTPSPTVSPSPAAPANFVVAESLRNDANAIIYRTRLNTAGAVRYAVYNTDPGVLTAGAVKIASSTAVGGALVAAGTTAVPTAGVDTDITITGLPDKSFYTVYTVAEDTVGTLGAVKRYTRVIPRRLSMQLIQPGVASYLIRYYISYPTGHYDAATPSPVLISLHGDGERPNDITNAESNFLTTAKRMIKSSVPAMINVGTNLPFITISPQCNEALSACLAYTDMTYVDTVLATAKAALKADTKRIYVFGVSNGGNGAWRFAMRAPGDIAAIAPIMTFGLATDALIPALCNVAANDVGIWSIHNDGDIIAPKAHPISWITRHNGCAASATVPARLTLLADGTWPAFPNAVIYPVSEPDHHDAVSYVTGAPYFYYPAGPQRLAATPLHTDFVTELSAIEIAVGSPVNSLWDWFLLHSKP